MKRQEIEKLLELIATAVHWSSGTWIDKRDAILAEAGDEDKTNLSEFCGWFEEV